MTEEATYQSLISPRSRAPIVIRDDDEEDEECGVDVELFHGPPAAAQDQQMYNFQNSECVQQQQLRQIISTSPRSSRSLSAPNSGRLQRQRATTLNDQSSRHPITPRSKSYEETSSVVQIRRLLREVSKT